MIAAALVLTFVAACSSTTPPTDSAPATTVKKSPKNARTDIKIAQTSNMPAAARHVDGAIGIQYAMRVGNRTTENIRLTRVTVQTMSDGAYYVNPTSLPFNVAIAPDQSEDVQFWAPAVSGVTIVGNNGPVTLRVVCEFDSAAGRFQEVVVRQVNERTGINGIR